MNKKIYKRDCNIGIHFIYDLHKYINNKDEYKKELERLYNIICNNDVNYDFYLSTELDNLLYHLELSTGYGCCNEEWILEGWANVWCRCRKDGELYNEGWDEYKKYLEDFEDFYRNIKSDLFKVRSFKPVDIGDGDIEEY